MSRARGWTLTLLLAAGAAGAALPVVVASAGVASAAAAAGVALLVALLIWPWALVPTAIVGATAVSAAAGVSSVTRVVAVHGAVLVTGALALALRSLVAPLPARRRTPADLPMAILAAAVILGCLYGLIEGNRLHAALVASYELAVIPAYYWLATVTLAEAEDRRRALRLFVSGAVALAAFGLASPGRHGGLLSALGLVPVLVAASRTSRGQRWVMLGCAALLGVDVFLAAYRSVWLATGIALALLAIRGPRAARRTIFQVLALGAILLMGSLLVSHAASSRLSVVQQELHSSAGYRVPEAMVGLRAFARSPLFGHGMGQSTPNVWIPGFRIEDVGPVYHVFYVTVLANGGMVLLLAVAAAMLPALRSLAGRGEEAALPWAALLVGFLAAAAFAGPTDGHWELGLLPALVLLERPSPRRRPGTRTQAEPNAAVSPPASAESPRSAVCRESLAVAQLASRERPGIHAVIVAYCSREQIARCLLSLVGEVDRVTVIDNDSQDGTAQLVRELFPAVELIANHDNVGFAVAVNQALREVQHDTVMLVNPDCVLDPGAASRLHDHLSANPLVGIVAPRILNCRGEAAVSAHPFETLASVIASRFGASLIPRDLRMWLTVGQRRAAYRACSRARAPVEVDWASGACLMVRAELLRQVGGLDESYFMYYEDEELCLRAARAGMGVVYLPAATAHHSGGASSSDPAAVWPSLYASMLLFFARHRRSSVLALRLALLLRAAIGVVLAAARADSRRLLAWWRVAKVVCRGPRPAYGRCP